MLFFSFSGKRDLVSKSFFYLISILISCTFTLPVLAEEDSVSPVSSPSIHSAPPLLPDATSYTLAQSVEQALRANPQVLAQGFRVTAAARDSRIALGQMLPSATLSYGINFINNVSGSGAVDPDFIDQNSDTASLQVTQPLFAGGTLMNTYQKSLLGQELAEAQKALAESQVILDVQLTFLDLAKARGEVRSLRSAVTRLETTVEAVKAFERVRLAPYVDVLQTEVELADARQRLSKAEIEVTTHTITLNTLLGLPVDARTVYVDDFSGLEPEIPWALEACLERAMAQRPELRARRKALAMAEKDAAIAFGRYWPRVDLQGSYVKVDRDYEANAAFDRDYRTDYWTAGINVQWRLLEGGRTYYEHQRILSQISALREELRELTSKIAAQVYTFNLHIGEARQRLTTATKALGEATEALERAQVRFEARVASIVEVLDAQARLSLAEANHLQAQADIQKAQAQLLFAMGERNPSLRF